MSCKVLVVRQKKAKKSMDAGKAILDERGEPTDFIRGYSAETFTSVSVRNSL